MWLCRANYCQFNYITFIIQFRWKSSKSHYYTHCKKGRRIQEYDIYHLWSMSPERTHAINRIVIQNPSRLFIDGSWRHMKQWENNSKTSAKFCSNCCVTLNDRSLLFCYYCLLDAISVGHLYLYTYMTKENGSYSVISSSKLLWLKVIPITLETVCNFGIISGSTKWK